MGSWGFVSVVIISPVIVIFLILAIGLIIYYNHNIFDNFAVFQTIDVSGRRNVSESEILDEWLIVHFNDYGGLRSYFYRKFDAWDDKAKHTLSGVLLFKKHREEQYYALRNHFSNKYYDFFHINAVRYQTRYRQENYVRSSYKVPVYSFAILIHRVFQEILHLFENKAWLCTSVSLGLGVLPFLHILSFILFYRNQHCR